MSRLLSLALAAVLPASALLTVAPATARAQSTTSSSPTGPSTPPAAPAATPDANAAAAAQAQPAPAPAPQPQQQKKNTGPAPTAQQAQEDAGDTSELARDIGPLKDRIPPVTGHMFMMKGRFELEPTVGVSLRDAFFTKYMAGAELTYHFTEDLGIGARVAYAKPTVSGSAQICTNDGTTRGCTSPTFQQIDGRAPGQISLLGGVNLQWAPLYGKLSVVSEAFLHFDLYAVGGFELVQYAGPGGTNGGSVKKMTGGGDLGLGLRFFLSRWVTVRTELNDVIYSEEVQGNGNQLRNQLMFNLGVSFFFPMSFSEG